MASKFDIAQFRTCDSREWTRGSIIYTKVFNFKTLSITKFPLKFFKRWCFYDGVRLEQRLSLVVWFPFHMHIQERQFILFAGWTLIRRWRRRTETVLPGPGARSSSPQGFPRGKVELCSGRRIRVIRVWSGGACAPGRKRWRWKSKNIHVYKILFAVHHSTRRQVVGRVQKTVAWTAYPVQLGGVHGSWSSFASFGP